MEIELMGWREDRLKCVWIEKCGVNQWMGNGGTQCHQQQLRPGDWSLPIINQVRWTNVLVPAVSRWISKDQLGSVEIYTPFGSIIARLANRSSP